jgi:cytochrome P450
MKEIKQLILLKLQTDVLLCHMSTSNRDENFSDSKKYIPERWVKTPQPGCPVHKSDIQTHPYTMMPFGFGKRNCVGMRFAKLEIETIVARVSIWKYCFCTRK